MWSSYEVAKPIMLCCVTGSKKLQLSPTLSPPKEEDRYESDSSSGSSAYEEFLDQNQI